MTTNTEREIEIRYYAAQAVDCRRYANHALDRWDGLGALPLPLPDMARAAARRAIETQSRLRAMPPRAWASVPRTNAEIAERERELDRRSAARGLVAEVRGHLENYSHAAAIAAGRDPLAWFATVSDIFDEEIRVRTRFEEKSAP